MLGAIIGDIVGSIYEQNPIKTTTFPLFQKGCTFTDDTVMTCAVAEAIMKGGTRDHFIDTMKKYGRKYPNAGYGSRFKTWLFSDERKPYGSFGNGSAMRVSPCAWVVDMKAFSKRKQLSPEELALIKRSADVTHNHPEGIKGALAIAEGIVFNREAFRHKDLGGSFSSKEAKVYLQKTIEERYGYDLSLSLDEIRPSYSFDSTSQGSVPQAIRAFLESDSFEEAIRNAVSLGGDSDTLAAMAGSLAEAAYGIPDEIKTEGLSYLDDELKDVLSRFQRYLNHHN